MLWVYTIISNAVNEDISLRLHASEKSKIFQIILRLWLPDKFLKSLNFWAFICLCKSAVNNDVYGTTKRTGTRRKFVSLREIKFMKIP